ncbi:hypothetical protein ON010_g6714 [Phytophthora cinnamomi]|nr:hypothetical protein ON010_g6714 [Phytophthora cinnamomi]
MTSNPHPCGYRMQNFALRLTILVEMSLGPAMMRKRMTPSPAIKDWEETHILGKKRSDGTKEWARFSAIYFELYLSEDFRGVQQDHEVSDAYCSSSPAHSPFLGAGRSSYLRTNS